MANNKGKLWLLLIGFLLCILAIAIVAIRGLIYENTPGARVSFDDLKKHVDQKVTVEGILGQKLRLVTVWDGDVEDYYDVYSFYSVAGQQSGKTIELQFKSSKYPNVKEGDRLTVTGEVGLDDRAGFISVY
jgi:hypothetical protein